MFDRISDFALGEVQVPQTAMAAAATLLIDTLGVAAGAAGMEAGRIARDHAVRFQAGGTARDSATMMFDGRMASLTGAGFAAATQIDNLDAHDGYNPTKGHIGCAVVPALCVLAEQQPELLARDALTAMVLAYEIAGRAALALHASVTDYHTSGAWNALGVAALGCRLRGHEPDQLRQALGIAEYHGPRSQMVREIANPTMLHDGSGMGAMVGLMAVLLAEEGFAGAPAVTVEAEGVAAHWSDLGEVWTIEQNYIKPYPICRWAHAAIDALDKVMREYDLPADAIDTVEVGTFREAAALYAGMPQTTSQAQYSLPFALAVRWVHGAVGPDHIQGAGLSDAHVAQAVERIRVREVSRHSERFPVGRWSDVTLRLRDGRVLQSGDVHARGGPEAPMDDATFEAKFRTMAASLASERQDRLLGMRQRLLQPDARFSELLELIHAPAEGGNG